MRAKPRPWQRVKFIASLVATLAIVVSIVATGDASTQPPVRSAAADLARWSGISYRGELVDPDDVITNVDLTVTAEGAAHGRLTRDFGAQAEFAVDDSGTLLKGNRQWWLYEQPALADQLADQWVDNPADRGSGMVPVAQLTPAALAKQLAAPATAKWTGTGEVPEGSRGRVFSDGSRNAEVTSSLPARLLSVALPLSVPAPPAPRAYVSGDTFRRQPPDMKDWRAAFIVSEPDTRQSHKVRQAASDIKRSLAKPPQTINQLTASPPNLDTGMLGRLAQRGIDATLADNAGVYGNPMLEVLDKLTDPQGYNTTAKDATFILKNAAGARAFAALHQLVVSGQLRNPEDLFRFMSKIKQSGQLRHLEEAARRAALGHQVDLDPDPPKDSGTTTPRYKADILDYTTKEAVQQKAIGASTKGGVEDNVQSAVRQLNGETGEAPPPGWDRVVHLHFEANAYNNLGTGSRGQVQQTLRSMDLPRKARLLETHKDGKPIVTKVVVTNFANVTQDSRTPERYAFSPAELEPPPGPGGTTPPGPQPRGPQPAPPAQDMFSRPGTGKPDGPLADLTKGGPDAPGGIDFTSLELRYLADTGSEDDPSMRYAFSARPAVAGGEHREAGLQSATLASDAFFVWLSLPRSAFWVNLNPDEADRITDADLGKTDVGRIMLEADLRLKQDMARLQHPATPLGEKYWQARDAANSLDYCFVTRLWIVPAPAKVSAEEDTLHILDAPLTVQLEKSDVKTVQSPECARSRPSDSAQHQHEELQRTLLLPALTRMVNEAPGYGDLRRVYFSRVAAEWYRQRAAQKHTQFADLIDSGDVSAWPSRNRWSPHEVFNRYRTSFVQGDYTAPLRTSRGESNITNGGIELGKVALVKVGAAELQSRWPKLTTTVGDSFDHPTKDPAGRIWLGSVTTRSGFTLPPPQFFLIFGALIALLWFRFRWRRRNRRKQPAFAGPRPGKPSRPSGPPSADAVSARLAQLRQENRE